MSPTGLPPTRGSEPSGLTATLHPPFQLGATLALIVETEPNPRAAGISPIPVSPPSATGREAQDSLVNADFDFQLIVQLWKLDQQPARVSRHRG